MAFDSTGQMAACARDFEQDMVVFDTETEKGQLHPITQTSTESMLKALIMGPRDYAHKCGFKKAQMGISGGIDSALTACIAVKALGSKNVLCVFMPSEYTFQQSCEDAKNLARNLQEEEVIPKRILQKPPSAELKPGQVDQDDLPAYDILDGILRAYIEDNKVPDEITAMGLDPSTVREVIHRVDRNEYKRHQAPPGLKVTSRSFGTERRYPLAWKSWR